LKHERRRQTDRRSVYAGSRLKLIDVPGRSRLTSQPSSRNGENPPCGMIGGTMETAASFEVRNAPSSYPTIAISTFVRSQGNSDQAVSMGDLVAPRRHIPAVGPKCDRDAAPRRPPFYGGGNEAKPDRIEPAGEHDRNCRGRSFCCFGRGSIGSHKHSHVSANEFGRKLWQTLVLAISETILDCNVALDREARFRQRLQKRRT
jgi:hypothetical protein